MVCMHSSWDSDCCFSIQHQPHQAQQRDGLSHSPIVKQTLIEDSEQRVKDCAVGLEDLINECHISLGQVSLSLQAAAGVFESSKSVMQAGMIRGHRQAAAICLRVGADNKR